MFTKRLFQHPETHIVNQSRLLKYGDKTDPVPPSWRRHSSTWVTLQSRRFFPLSQLHLRLILQENSSFLQRISNNMFVYKIVSAICFPVAPVVENNLFFDVFRFIHRQVAFFKKSVRIFPVIRIHRHTLNGERRNSASFSYPRSIWVGRIESSNLSAHPNTCSLFSHGRQNNNEITPLLSLRSRNFHPNRFLRIVADFIMTAPLNIMPKVSLITLRFSSSKTRNELFYLIRRLPRILWSSLIFSIFLFPPTLSFHQNRQIRRVCLVQVFFFESPKILVKNSSKSL